MMTKSTKKYKKVQKYKSTHNSDIFGATDSRFCMEVHMDCPSKWQSTKVQKIQKYKNTKVQKYKTAEVQKYKTHKQSGWWGVYLTLIFFQK